MTLEQKARQLRTIFEQVAENGTEIFVYNATCIEMLRISQEAIGGPTMYVDRSAKCRLG